MSVELETHNRILLVDDEPDVLLLLRRLLDGHDFDVVGEAANGLEAIAVALREEPDVVILDYMMPKLDGEKTATQLRFLFPDIRILALSAIVDRKPHWADAFLDKINIDKLVPMLESWNGKGSAA